MHCRFGLLPALMTSGYITADAFELVKNNPFNIERIAELFRRLAAAGEFAMALATTTAWVSRIGASSPERTPEACSRHARALAPATRSSGTLATCSACCITGATTSAT